jgi:hypothetical protein
MCALVGGEDTQESGTHSSGMHTRLRPFRSHAPVYEKNSQGTLWGLSKCLKIRSGCVDQIICQAQVKSTSQSARGLCLWLIGWCSRSVSSCPFCHHYSYILYLYIVFVAYNWLQPLLYTKNVSGFANKNVLIFLWQPAPSIGY